MSVSYSLWLSFLVLAFTAYACYTDLKTGTIKNLCSLGLIYLGLLAQLVFLLQYEITVPTFLTTLLGGAVTTFALYWFGILGAGDAKLFYGICFALPPSLFQLEGHSPLFPPLVLAVHIFVPYTLFLLLLLLLRTSFQEKIQILREGLHPASLGSLGLLGSFPLPTFKLR